MMNAITTSDCKLVRRLLDKHDKYGVNVLWWGKYRYHIAEIWDGTAWHNVVMRAPRGTTDLNLDVLYCYL